MVENSLCSVSGMDASCAYATLNTPFGMPHRSVVNHPIATLGAYLFNSHGIGFAGPSRARLAIKPNHVHFQCPIWHLALRTNNSPPVASHLSSQTRSYYRFHGIGTPAEWSSTTQGCAPPRRTRERIPARRVVDLGHSPLECEIVWRPGMIALPNSQAQR